MRVVSRPHDDEDVAGHVLGWGARRAGAVAPTVVRLSSSHPAGVPEGHPLALAAHVVTLGPDVGAPVGEVLFTVDGVAVGEAALDAAGQAVLAGQELDVGVHAVVASYRGDARHAAATSAALPQAVTASAARVVVLVAAPRAAAEGVVLEAELVDPRTGRLAEAATGELRFAAEGRDLATVPLSAGVARAVLARRPPGRVVVSYDGDREHAAAAGAQPVEEESP